MRIFLVTALMAPILTFTACSPQTTAPQADNANSSIDGHPLLPPLAKQFSCLPQEAAITAAHRGTARNKALSENSMRSLNALMEKGYLIAEIDIAGLKDGTHILFHDGVWEEDSTGKGAVAASTWNQVRNYLLNDTDGKLTSDTPAKLGDYLEAAKGKIYLEIDFKSSAKYEHVINMIRDYDMADQVILISYNEGQSKKLARLAPEMMLSVSVRNIEDIKSFKPGQIAAWLGDGIENTPLIKELREANIPVLGRIRKEISAQKADAADLLVTDYAFKHEPITGLTDSTRIKYEACLNSN